MTHIGVVTLFPEMFDALKCCGITARAFERRLLRLALWNPRDFARDRHRTVDDRPYGGGPGMVMLMQPLRDAIRAARADMGPESRTVYLSPQGRRLDHAGVEELSSIEHLLLVCGRYEGVDERVVVAAVDEEWSIGDYVLTGGELGAMVIIDAVARQLPGALGHGESAKEDSFAGGLLDCPHYTRPEEIDGLRVPDVLLTGDHESIRLWRLKQAVGRTWLRRPDLLDSIQLTDEQKAVLQQFIEEHERSSK